MPDDTSNNLPVVTQRVRERLRELKWYGGGDGYNASDFARRVDIGYATAHALLAGDTSSPDAATLEKVADTLRVSVDWLLGRDRDFDVRAYELGRDYVANTIGEALSRALATSPPEDGPDALGLAGDADLGDQTETDAG